MDQEFRIEVIITVLNLMYTRYLRRHAFPSSDVMPHKLFRQIHPIICDKRTQGG